MRSKRFSANRARRSLALVPSLLGAVCVMSLASASASAPPVGTGPHASMPAPALPIAVDHAFAGEIELHVDATDIDHSIFRVRERIPVQQPGDVVLLYPEWETASHAPTASAIGLAGLVVNVDGQRVAWQRDAVNMHAFHVTVPAGAQGIDLSFDYLSPVSAARLRPEMTDVEWHRMLLYPAGWYARNIPVAATLQIPPGQNAFAPLRQTAGCDGAVHFATTDLERLVDSPVYAGRYTLQTTLASLGARPVSLDILADDPSNLKLDRATLAEFRHMVAEAGHVFGPAPFERYEMVMSLSDVLSPGGGIEHAEMGENNLPGRYLVARDAELNNADLVAHEFVHAWNGRFRQPADLWTPTFNEPIRDSLLWVYEGQTEFWGRILAARAGMRTYQQNLDKLAMDAAFVARRPGRRWKSLADSTNDPIYMAGNRVDLRDWQRRSDFYAEGVILWLDVDARLRELTGGRRGLDDFARRFFAADHAEGSVSTYTFDDVCEVLKAIAKADWRTFLLDHLTTRSDEEALAGLERSGWRLVYKDQPSETFRQDQGDDVDLSDSIGMTVDKSGRIRSVVWDGPAFKAGLAAGQTLKQVGEHSFTQELLLSAVAHPMAGPIRLEVDGRASGPTVSVAYAGGLRYPWLERDVSRPDRLTPLLHARLAS